jgi:hypothetical protein
MFMNLFIIKYHKIEKFKLVLKIINK